MIHAKKYFPPFPSRLLHPIHRHAPIKRATRSPACFQNGKSAHPYADRVNAGTDSTIKNLRGDADHSWNRSSLHARVKLFDFIGSDFIVTYNHALCKTYFAVQTKQRRLLSCVTPSSKLNVNIFFINDCHVKHSWRKI